MKKIDIQKKLRVLGKPEQKITYLNGVLSRGSLMDDSTRNACYEILGDNYLKVHGREKAISAYESAGIPVDRNLLGAEYSSAISERNMDKVSKLEEKGFEPTQDKIENAFRSSLKDCVDKNRKGSWNNQRSYFRKKIDKKTRREIVQDEYVKDLEGEFSNLYLFRILSNSNLKFNSKTKQQRDLVKKAYDDVFFGYKEGVGNNMKYSPFYPGMSDGIRKLQYSTGIEPSIKDVFTKGKEIALEVKEGRVNPGYLKEFVEVTGRINLAPTFYKIAGMINPFSTIGKLKQKIVGVFN